MRKKIRNIFSLSGTMDIINSEDFDSKEITESVELHVVRGMI